jgi:hypothetical protein
MKDAISKSTFGNRSSRSSRDIGMVLTSTRLTKSSDGSLAGRSTLLNNSENGTSLETAMELDIKVILWGSVRNVPRSLGSANTALQLNDKGTDSAIVETDGS